MIILFAALGVTILIWFIQFFGIGGVIDQKSVYAELQGVEIQYRNQKIVTPLVLGPDRIREQQIAGFKTNDEHFPYAWIALSAESPSAKIYMVPGDASLRISCTEAVDFLQKNAVVATVTVFLKNQCREKP